MFRDRTEFTFEDAMPDITVCLLNWKRPENLPPILDSIASQSVATRIFLWDNGDIPLDDRRIDWRVRSSRNMVCWPRWFMAVHADTDFVCTLDDDLRFADRHVLRDGIRAAEGLQPDQLVGPFGRILSKDLSYSGGFNVWGSKEGRKRDRRIDVVKGRHILARTTVLRERLPIHIPPPPEDDIAVSGLLAAGRLRHHVRPGAYLHRLQRFQELPAPHAIWQQPGHPSRRDEAVSLYFRRAGGAGKSSPS